MRLLLCRRFHQYWSASTAWYRLNSTSLYSRTWNLILVLVSRPTRVFTASPLMSRTNLLSSFVSHRQHLLDVLFEDGVTMTTRWIQPNLQQNMKNLVPYASGVKYKRDKYSRIE